MKNWFKYIKMAKSNAELIYCAVFLILYNILFYKMH